MRADTSLQLTKLFIPTYPLVLRFPFARRLSGSPLRRGSERGLEWDLWQHLVCRRRREEGLFGCYIGHSRVFVRGDFYAPTPPVPRVRRRRGSFPDLGNLNRCSGGRRVLRHTAQGPEDSPSRSTRHRHGGHRRVNRTCRPAGVEVRPDPQRRRDPETGGER